MITSFEGAVRWGLGWFVAGCLASALVYWVVW